MKKDPRLKKYGLKGFNKPKKTPGHKTKSHVVLARDGGRTKLIRFGQQGVRGFGGIKGKAAAKKRAAFRARHAKNIRKGKMSGAYWANRVKW